MSKAPSWGQQKRDNQLFEGPEEKAVAILSRSLSRDEEEVRKAVIDLIHAGYMIAPLVPTNSMLDAYLHSYGETPSRTMSVLTAVGKAKRRWKAMAEAGISVVMSRQ